MNAQNVRSITRLVMVCLALSTASTALAQDADAEVEYEPRSSVLLGLDVGVGLGAVVPDVTLLNGSTIQAVENPAFSQMVAVHATKKFGQSFRLTFGVDAFVGTDSLVTGHTSASILFSTGMLLGNTEKKGRFYAHAAVGYGLTNVSDRVDDKDLEEFGANGRGLGFRLELGRTISYDTRVGLTLLAVNFGDPDDELLPNASVQAGYVSIAVRL